MKKTMYKELQIYGRDLTQDKVQAEMFEAVRYNLSGISVSPFFIPELVELIPEGMVISSPIGYPNGTADTKIKQHATLAAIRKGANAIDLVLNPHLISAGKMTELCEDIIGNMEICGENGATLRIMMEYRVFTPAMLLDVAALIKEVGVEYVFPSTGHMLDNSTDNLLMSMALEKSGLRAITNGNIYKMHQYESIKKSGVFGVRFKSSQAIKNLLDDNGV